MMKQALVSILVMAIVTYLIRMLPMVLFTKPINNQFVKSFLAYVPCVVLACMTFPAIFSATRHPLSGIGAALIAIILAFKKKGLVIVAVSAVLCVFILEQILFI